MAVMKKKMPKKKATPKPTPGMLGSGGAAATGKRITGRQKQLDAQINAITGGGKKTKKKVVRKR